MKSILKSATLFVATATTALAYGAELPTSKPEREGMSSDRLERVQAMQDRYTS